MVTTPGTPTPLWGFCARCEAWRYSTAWLDATERASCPECGSAPALLESADGDRTRLHIVLKVPPEAGEPLL